MATVLEELVIKLDADLSDLKNGLRKGESAAKKSSGKMAQSMKKITDSVNKSRDAINKYGTIAIAAFAGVTAAIVRSQLKQIDAIAKTSDKLGIQTEELIGLQHAAELSGVGANTLSVALQRMTRRASEAANGTGVMVGTLKELNIDAQEFAALSPDKQFVRLTEAFEGVASQGDRVRLAMQAFDTEGVSLVNTMALGADGLRAATEEAIKFGTAISRADAAKIEAANDAMFRAQQAFEGAARTLTVEFAPIIEAVANKFIEMATEGEGFGDAIREGFSIAIDIVGIFADGLFGIKVIFKTLEIAAEGFLLLTESIFKKLIDETLLAVNGFRQLAGLDPLEGMSIGLDDNLDRISNLKTELGELLDGGLPSEGLKATIEEISVAAEEAAGRVAMARTNALAGGGDGATTEDPTAAFGGVAEAQLSPEEQLEAIAIQNELELALLAQKQATEQAVLDSAFELKSISEAEFLDKSVALRLKHNKTTEMLEKEHQKKLLQNQKFGELSSLNSFLKNNSDTISAAASFASDSFGITKKLDLASAFVDTAAGVAKALAQGPSGIPAAAAIAIKGAAQIKAIKGQSLGGGGGGVPAVGGGVSASAPEPVATPTAAATEATVSEPEAATNRKVITVISPEGGFFTTEMVRDLIDQIAIEAPNLQVDVV